MCKRQWGGGAEGLGRNRTYRAFVAHPTMIVGLGGELLNAAPVMSRLASYRLVFGFDKTRFTEGKVALPVIKVQDGQGVFIVRRRLGRSGGWRFSRHRR